MRGDPDEQQDQQRDQHGGRQQPALGEQESGLLRWVAEHAPVTVRDVWQGFGEPRGLAKTTVQTVMERLRQKGYLVRAKQRPGGFFYRPAGAPGDLLRGLVRDFVRRTLGGSLSPFVAYLAEGRQLTDEEFAVLTRVAREAEQAEQAQHQAHTEAAANKENGGDEQQHR